MRQIENADGIALTAADASHIAAYDALITAFVGFRRETGAMAKTLAEDAPEMPMALAAKGYLSKMAGSAEGTAAAGRAAKALGSLVDAGHANAHERTHAAALDRWLAGDMDGATRLWEGLTADTPGDTLALRLQHFTHFYTGEGRRIRDGIARVLPHYRPGHRHYGYVQGMYAFGLEEAGDYAAAERHGKIAVGENPGDAWSVHAVAHAFEMTGRGEEGLAFTAALEPDWGQVNNFRYHLHWHRGLYLLEQNRTAEVLALYDAEVGADPDSGFYLDMLNCSSMLWRLEMQGVDVGDRWQALAGVAAKRSGEEELIFVTLHYAMALIAAGRPGQIDALEAHLEAWAAKPTTQGAIVAAVGLPLFRAMRLLRVGRAGEALAALLPLRYAIDPIGGSHAQRDVFQMALITAAEAAGQPRMARALLAERVALKPHGCWGWQRYAAALRSVGERAAAEAAETRAADAAAGRLVAA